MLKERLRAPWPFLWKHTELIQIWRLFFKTEENVSEHFLDIGNIFKIKKRDYEMYTDYVPGDLCKYVPADTLTRVSMQLSQALARMGRTGAAGSHTALFKNTLIPPSFT